MGPKRDRTRQDNTEVSTFFRLETLEVEYVEGEARKGELQAKIADLNKKLSAENHVEQEKAEAERFEAKCRAAAGKQADAVNKVVQVQVECQTNIDNNRTSTETLQQDIADHRKRIDEYRAKIARKQEALAPVEADHENAAKRFNEARNG